MGTRASYSSLADAPIDGKRAGPLKSTDDTCLFTLKIPALTFAREKTVQVEHTELALKFNIRWYAQESQFHIESVDEVLEQKLSSLTLLFGANQQTKMKMALSEKGAKLMDGTLAGRGFYYQNFQSWEQFVKLTHDGNHVHDAMFILSCFWIRDITLDGRIRALQRAATKKR